MRILVITLIDIYSNALTLILTQTGSKVKIKIRIKLVKHTLILYIQKHPLNKVVSLQKPCITAT